MSIREICESTTETFTSKNGVISLPTGNTLSKSQRRYLNLASRLAEMSDVEKRHGAVVVRGGRVLAVGTNKWRNKDLLNNLEYNPNLTVHAEIDALSRVEDPSGAIVYISRINKKGREAFSRPCDRCIKALMAANVKAVIYTVKSH